MRAMKLLRPRVVLALPVALAVFAPAARPVVAQDKQPGAIATLEQQARGGDAGKAFELGAHGAAAIPALARLLADDKLPEPVRYMSANGLGATRLPAAIKPLLPALDDPLFNVRRCAAEALGQLGAKDAIGRLRQLATGDPFVWRDPTSGDRRWLVRESAIKALRALGETPPGLPADAPGWRQPPIRTGTPFSDALPWADTVEAALERARREHKPVLATVVAIGDARWSSGWQGAAAQLRGLDPPPFGDERAQQIDEGLVKERALMAVLFTDPDIAASVREHFVPVRLRVHTYAFDAVTSTPAIDPLRLLGTTGVDCPAPALVFADADGRLLHACRRLGALHVPTVRAMLRAVLQKAGGVAVATYRPAPHERLDAAWELVWQGDLAAADARLRDVPAADRGFEAAYLRGLVADRRGDGKQARALWEQAAKGDALGPWGSKAAAYLLPTGPALREWESLHAPVLEPLAPTTELRRSAAALSSVLHDAVAYLLKQQLVDGSWGNPFVDPHPAAAAGSELDLTVARTALVVDALHKTAARVPALAPAAAQAAARGVDCVGRFADAPAPHVWQLTYALHLQLELLRDGRGDQDLARARAAKLIAALRPVQHGGWSYMPPPRIHSFNTAPVLLMLAELRGRGVAVPDAMIDEASRFLAGLRSGKDAREFRYASNIDHQSLVASSCRTAACELALAAAAGVDSSARLTAAVELFFGHEPNVRATTKIFESYFSVGAMHDAYHYYFGHYYVARALAHLPAAAASAAAARQRDILLGQVESDGTFVDAQMQGKSYSTAMALLTLAEDLRYLGP
jgi:hypothetical protein